jgi:hypothetical protein
MFRAVAASGAPGLNRLLTRAALFLAGKERSKLRFLLLQILVISQGKNF